MDSKIEKAIQCMYYLFYFQNHVNKIHSYLTICIYVKVLCHARGKLIFHTFCDSINELMNNIPSMGVFIGNHKISVPKYADDLVLCTVTSDGLQLGMNAWILCE